MLSYLVVLPVNVGLVGEGDGQGEAGEEHQEPQQAVARPGLRVQQVSNTVQAGVCPIV